MTVPLHLAVKIQKKPPKDIYRSHRILQTNHEFWAGYRKERTTFADGTTVTVDWDTKMVTISPKPNIATERRLLRRLRVCRDRFRRFRSSAVCRPRILSAARRLRRRDDASRPRRGERTSSLAGAGRDGDRRQAFECGGNPSRFSRMAERMGCAVYALSARRISGDRLDRERRHRAGGIGVACRRSMPHAQSLGKCGSADPSQRRFGGKGERQQSVQLPHGGAGNDPAPAKNV